MKKKILFITTSLNRTGAEMMLWYLLCKLDPNKFDISLFTLRKGELLADLPPYINKMVSYKGSGLWYKKIFRAVLKLLGKEPIAYQLQQLQKKIKADVWYVNTITIPQVYSASKNEVFKIATHVHEYMFAYGYVRSEAFKHMIEQSDYLIGCSPSVCLAMQQLGHPKVVLQNSFINDKLIKYSNSRVEELKQQHHIQADDFVWVVSGYTTYMKGIDFILPIAEHFKNRPIKILWLGAIYNDGLDYYVRAVAEKNRYKNLIFTNAVADDYYNYFALAHAYLSLSREECLSLAMLEAAALGKPIVSFNTGIVKAFIKPGMGTVVNSFVADDMIRAMETHMEHTNCNVHLLTEAVKDYTIESQLPKFEKMLLQICS